MNRNIINAEEGNRSRFTYDEDSSDNESLASFETVQTVERLIHNQTSGFIFLILLQMETKKFEIIQVPIFFNTTTTSNPLTIADILHHIAVKATDPVLAHQRYRGICRPSNGIEMINLSASVIDEDGECRIVPGEVLVPIPENKRGHDCMIASKCVLNLPAFGDLFQNYNLLEPKKTSSRRDEDMISYDIIDMDVFNNNYSTIDYGVTSYPNEIEIDGLNENKVKVVVPTKSPRLQNLIERPLRALRKYEEQIIYRIQKNLPLSNHQDSRVAARAIVKASKFIITFISTRTITLAGIRCIIDIPTTDDATERPFIVRFVEFILFLSFLIWFQKRSYVRTQKKVLRSSHPRKLVYGY